MKTTHNSEMKQDTQRRTGPVTNKEEQEQVSEPLVKNDLRLKRKLHILLSKLQHHLNFSTSSLVNTKIEKKTYNQVILSISNRLKLIFSRFNHLCSTTVLHSILILILTLARQESLKITWNYKLIHPKNSKEYGEEQNTARIKKEHQCSKVKVSEKKSQFRYKRTLKNYSKVYNTGLRNHSNTDKIIHLFYHFEQCCTRMISTIIVYNIKNYHICKLYELCNLKS